MDTLGSKPVGSTIKLKVNGVAKNFIIVHQGNPSASYDSSCDGTWLLMKDIYASQKWHGNTGTGSNSYANSSIHSYLNSTFLDLLDSDIKSAVKTVKIPYSAGGKNGKVYRGTSGLSTQIFLLSRVEVGYSASSYANNEGIVLSYFNGAENSNRIAYLSGTATRWWTRTPRTDYEHQVWYVESTGADANTYVTSSFGVRPALILPTTLFVDGSWYVVANLAPTISGADGSLGTFSTTKPTVNYTINDENKDSVTATIKLNGTTKETKTVALGTAYTYTPSAADWAALALGSHTITITASDGKKSVTRTYTFVKEKPVLGTVTVDGMAKEYKDVYVNVGGAWKEAEKVYVMVNGVWKSV